jgi:apolipoprotein N-acyltransferase
MLWRDHGAAYRRRGWVAALVIVAVPSLALAYGAWRIAGEPRPDRRPLDVLLVQGSIDTELKHDPDAAGQVARHTDHPAPTVGGLIRRG